MEIKDSYDIEEVVDLLAELQDLGVDIDELPEETTLAELVKMRNRILS